VDELKRRVNAHSMPRAIFPMSFRLRKKRRVRPWTRALAVHAMDHRGSRVLRKTLRRDALLAWSAAVPPCVMATEACGGAHHWARELTRQGRTVRIIAAEFVRPFRKSGKNDAMMRRRFAQRHGSRICASCR
jgi:transposase